MRRCVLAITVLGFALVACRSTGIASTSSVSVLVAASSASTKKRESTAAMAVRASAGMDVGRPKAKMVVVPTPPVSEGILPVSPEAYVDRARIWRRKSIPVCWEIGDEVFSGEMNWVEIAVHEVMENASSVRFTGIPGSYQRWPRCGANSLGIRIAVTNMRPRSFVGQQWQKNADGTETERPTLMRLNFGTGLYASACAHRRRQCVVYLAVHEFAHAIGFLHEHLREDAPVECKEKYAHDADEQGYDPVPIGTSFDSRSITNYCANIFQDPMPPTRLSDLDVLAINTFYRLD